MSGTKAFIQLPPDSTGKKLGTQRNIHIDYSGGLVAFSEGDLVTGLTSGASGRVYKVTGGVSTGSVYIVEIPADVEFEVGEALGVGGVAHAAIATVHPVHNQATVNVGANNPHNGQFVDNQGSAYIRFADGPQQLDAAGRTKVSNETVIADYSNLNSIEPNQYLVTTAGDGAATHDASSAAALMTVGTANGALVTRRTHRYHHYFYGKGVIITMVMGNNDTGKANNIRRWGVMDDTEGLFFQLGGTGLVIGQRTSSSGSLFELFTPLTEVNGDPCDGTGISGFTLDPSKMNAYWFDFQAGVRSRIGVYNGFGDRIVINTFSQANILSYSGVRSPSLPISYENFNTGPTSGVSVLRHQSAQVAVEGFIFPFFANYGGGMRDELTLTTTLAPVIGLRPSLTVNGIINRVHIMPLNYTVLVEGGNALVQVVQTPTGVTGDTWSTSLGAVDIDTTATAAANGRIMWSVLLEPGTHVIDLKDVYDLTSTSLRLFANGTQGQTIFLMARRAGSGTVTISATANWQQLE